MKVLHNKGIFSIEGITVINPEIFPEAVHYYRDGDYFDLPGNITAEIDEIDTVEDGGGCYVAGSKTVYRLKLKEPLSEYKEKLKKQIHDEDFLDILSESYISKLIDDTNPYR